MTGLRALDLFCGGGGVCEGLQRAGFLVDGMDTNRNCAKYYSGRFILQDVRELNQRDIEGYDLVWASPPCQAWSSATPSDRRGRHPQLIEFCRHLFANHSYSCIENVPRAPLRPDLILTGPMVGLDRIVRARVFELSWFTFQPSTSVRPDPRHMVVVTQSLSHQTHYYKRKKMGLSGRLSPAEARAAMGISHIMPGKMVGEAIPPAMAQWIANSALEHGLGASAIPVESLDMERGEGIPSPSD